MLPAVNMQLTGVKLVIYKTLEYKPGMVRGWAHSARNSLICCHRPFA